VALDKINALVFIEEPEAHLFPVAQKQIVELMCFMSNSLNTNFIITTHSPYILTSINNFIYAGILGKKYKGKVTNILPDNTWLKEGGVNGYFVENGQLIGLYDNDLNMFKTELIDTASDLVNSEYEMLLEIEREG
jgi:predicted ATPase